MSRARSAALIVVSALVLTAGVVGLDVVRGDRAAHSLVVPAAWRDAWAQAHVREGRTVALAWGDRAGEDPRQAPPDLRFDAARAVAQLDALYALDVDALRVVRADGPVAEHKIVVVVDGTWSSGPGAPGASVSEPGDGGGLSAASSPTDGTVKDGVGVLRTDAASLRGSGSGAASEFDPSWQLARAFAQVVQGFAVLDRPGGGFASDEAKTFWPVSAAYLASLAAPGSVGGLADLIRAPQLHWGSARLGQGGWLLLQYLADRDGNQLVGDLWQQAEAADDPLQTYRRVTGLSQAGLARRVTEYAMHTVTWDFSDSSALAHALGKLDPALLVGRTTPVTTVAGDRGHFAVLDAFAPSDYGFDLIRLRPDAPLATIRMHLAAHGGTTDGALSFGFVAVSGGTARYSPVTTSNDAQVQFQLHAGENDAYLVVAGTPQALHSYASSAGVGDVPRYPYDFRLEGATVDPTTGSTPAGMHRHANGGGLVDDRATVDATAYVGPDAVVRGDAQVLEHARVEDRAWIEGGAVVTGDAVVRDLAVVRSGSRLDAGVVVGGDAVVKFTCSVGTYATFDLRRGCDGAAGRPDVNPVVTPFDAARVALGGASSAPDPAPSATSSPTSSADPTVQASGQGVPTQPQGQPQGHQPGGPGSNVGPGGTPPPGPGGGPTGGPQNPPPGGVAPPEPVQSSPCQAVYRVNSTWTDGAGQSWFTADVTVTGTGAGVKGWSVAWSLAPGVQITYGWNAMLGTNGRIETAENTSDNGTVRPGETAVFGFQGTAPSEAVGRQVPQISCTPTR